MLTDDIKYDQTSKLVENSQGNLEGFYPSHQSSVGSNDARHRSLKQHYQPSEESHHKQNLNPIHSGHNTYIPDPLNYQNVPQQQYMGPQQQYMGPQQQYIAPQQQYMGPQQQYIAPQQQYIAPQQYLPFDCPPGLEYLANVDHLIIKQKWEIAEVVLNFEIANKYTILNGAGQVVYSAHEESGCMNRQCNKHQRSFKMHILDMSGREVMKIKRPCHCACCCLIFKLSGCCLDEVIVEAPPGQVAGYVKEVANCCKCCATRYDVMDANKKEILLIRGSGCCHIKCPGEDIVFKLITTDGNHQIGRISKKWSNLVKEFFTDSDNFGVQFPIDLDVKIKAVVIGAVFLIDFMHFEDNEPIHGK